MSRHCYTNPAFCQESEFFTTPSSSTSTTTTNKPPTNKPPTNNATVRTQRSESMRSNGRIMRSLQTTKSNAGCKLSTVMMHRQQRDLPPKPGPKPLPQRQKNGPEECNDGYALVPLTELPHMSKGRYAVVPADEAKMMRSTSSMRLTRSRDHLDLLVPPATPKYAFEDENSFTSLPAFTPHDNDNDYDDDERSNARQLASAFSTDFISESMFLVNPNGMQRYAIVPTDDDEEVVDSNHEIIQMHNGRAHRYAVIPTDEEETCLSDDFEMGSCARNPYDSVQNVPAVGRQLKSKPFTASAAQKKAVDYARHPMPAQRKLPTNAALAPNAQKSIHQPDTPTKNPIATQKLHELLSTPRKMPMQRHGSYHTIVQKSPEHRYRSQIICSTPKQSEFTPQKLQYEPHMVNRQMEPRTTAVISPRLHQQTIYNDTTSSIGFDKMHDSFHKIEKATATIGVVSLMLLLAGAMNSGLCLYMVTNVSGVFAFARKPFSLHLPSFLSNFHQISILMQMRRSYFLDLGIVSGFAAAALGLMGFRSRQCDWLPNRNYISGKYIL